MSPLNEVEILRGKNSDLYAENSVLAKENIRLIDEVQALQIEVAVQKERLERYASYRDHDSKGPAKYVLDIFKLSSIAAAFAAISKAFEHWKL